MKKMMSVLMILVSILSSTTGVFAVSTNEGQPLDSQKSNLSGYFEIRDEQAVVSEVLTFNELVEIIAKDNNISIMEAINEITGDYTKGNVGINSLSINNLKALASNNTYRTVSSTLSVTSGYKPTLKFYLETSESDTMWGIVKILNVGMNRSYNGISKQFGGTVYTNLENSGRIFWIVNGDFYDNGTTTVSGGFEVEIGEEATVNFNLSHSSEHYAYYYKEGSYNVSF